MGVIKIRLERYKDTMVEQGGLSAEVATELNGLTDISIAEINGWDEATQAKMGEFEAKQSTPEGKAAVDAEIKALFDKHKGADGRLALAGFLAHGRDLNQAKKDRGEPDVTCTDENTTLWFNAMNKISAEPGISMADIEACNK